MAVVVVETDLQYGGGQQRGKRQCADAVLDPRHVSPLERLGERCARTIDTVVSVLRRHQRRRRRHAHRRRRQDGDRRGGGHHKMAAGHVVGGGGAQQVRVDVVERVEASGARHYLHHVTTNTRTHARTRARLYTRLRS